jgi:hypothetical protein
MNGADLTSPAIPLPENPLIALPGGTTLNAGGANLPLGLLCQQPGILVALTCNVCNLDCTYVHSKFGGSCGNSSSPVAGTPQETGPVCVCADSAPTDGTDFRDPASKCPVMISKRIGKEKD